MTMKITQVRFPCGRIGLEVEEERPAMGGSEPCYSYFVNGEDYAKVISPEEKAALKFDYYHRIQGLVRVNKHFIRFNAYDYLRELSRQFTVPTTERPHTPLPGPGPGATSPT
jgi:hypothetical protein